MSYVNKKVRVFKYAGDTEIVRKRSEGRMKSYLSAHDARAWCNDTEDRRQYILELVRREGKNLPSDKIIPLEALINILLGEKNATISQLQKELAALQDFINKLNLSPEEKKMLQGVNNELRKPSGILSKSGDEKEISSKMLDPSAKNFKCQQKESAPVADAVPAITEVSPIVDEPVASKQSIKPRLSKAVPTLPTESVISAPIPDDTTAPTEVPVAAKEEAKIEKEKSTTFKTPTEPDATLAAKPSEKDEGDEDTVISEVEIDVDPQQLIRALEQLETIKEIINDSEEENLKLQSIKEAPFKDRLEYLEGVEDDVKALKNNLNNNQAELNGLKAKFNECDKNFKKAKDENCCVRRLLRDKNAELDILKCKSKQADALICERNCMKLRLCNLEQVQRDYEELLKKTKGFDKIKQRYEELLGLECECNELKEKITQCEAMEKERNNLLNEIRQAETILAQKDNEIKNLVCHIDNLSKGRDTQQNKMKDAICSMRCKLAKKDDLIAASEQKLAKVQDQLKDTIEAVSCETACLKGYIEELEKKLVETDNCLKLANEKIAEFEELQAITSPSPDPHTEEILKLSKCGLKKIKKVLEDHFKIQGEIVEKQDTENIEKFNKQIEELEKCLCAATEKRKKLEDEKLMIVEENTILKKCLCDLQDEAKDLEAKAAQKQKLQEAENKALRKQSEALAEDIPGLKVQVNKEKQLRKEAENMIDALKKQLAALKSGTGEIESLQGLLAQQGIEAEAIRRQSETVEKLMGLQKDELLDEIKKLKSMNNELQKKLDLCEGKKGKPAKEAVNKLEKSESSQTDPSKPDEKRKKSSKAGDEMTDGGDKKKKSSRQSASKTVDKLEEQVDKIGKKSTVKRPSSAGKKLSQDVGTKLSEQEQKLKDCEERLKKAGDGEVFAKLQKENEELRTRLAKYESLRDLNKSSIDAVLESNDPDVLKKKILIMKEDLDKQKQHCEEMIENVKKQYDKDRQSRLSRDGSQEMGLCGKVCTPKVPLYSSPQSYPSSFGSYSTLPQCTSTCGFTCGTKSGAMPKSNTSTGTSYYKCGCLRTKPVKKECVGDSKLQQMETFKDKLMMQQQQHESQVESLKKAVESFKRDLQKEKNRNQELFECCNDRSKKMNRLKQELDIIKKENILDRKKLIQYEESKKDFFQRPPDKCGCSRDGGNRTLWQ